jgi:hypothetical protein
MAATTEPAVTPITEQFLRHGSILRDWSPQTVIAYRHAFRDLPAHITKTTLNDAVIAMRARGPSPGGINVRIRSINSFLTWAHDDGHLPERLRVKLLKAHRSPFRPSQQATSNIS